MGKKAELRQTKYQNVFVNRKGQVFSYNSRNVLYKHKLTVSKTNGYCYVGVRDANGKKKMVRVHRLIAQAFVPNTDGKPYIDHRDGNRTNNHYKNLRWVTNKENCGFYLSRMRRIQSKGIGAVQAECLQNGKKLTFDCYQYACKVLGLSGASVCRLLRGEVKKGSVRSFINGKNYIIRRVKAEQ